MLKGITKAKRRVTLSLVGLGMMDETEVVTIPGAERIAPEVMEDDDRNVPQRLKTVALADGGKGSVEHDPDRIETKNVTSVTRDSNENGEWWVITFEETDARGDLVKFTTFSSTIATKATEAYSSDCAVRVKTVARISKKTGFKYINIDSLELVGGEA